MEENEKSKIDKYTVKILRHLEQEKPPVDFTEKIMDVILSEQTDRKTIEAFGSKKFFVIFMTVFISIVLLAVFLPSGAYVLPTGLNAAKDVLGHFQIDFSFISSPIFSVLKGNVVLKILPIAVIALVILERLLLRYSDSWKT